MTKTPEFYTYSVFLNCPFDDDYDPILYSILFTVHRCGFVLRCAKEYNDSGTVRITKIIGLISECKYSIHDLSRVTLDDENLLPRFNMPLELGIVIGSKEFGNKNHKTKEYLILDTEKHRFKKFISDLAGYDISSHNDNPNDVIKAVRNWLVSKPEGKSNDQIPSASIVIKEFEQFNADLPELCKTSNWEVNELTFKEYSALVTSWLTFQ